MSFRPDVRPPIQDMPPPGGFPKIDINFRKGNRGPSGAVLWGVSSAAIMLGFYRAGTYNNMMKAEMLEERKARYAIAPILQAEADRAYLVQEKEILRQEAEIMKNVPGWKVGASTYTGDRWIPRNMAVLHKGLK